MYYESMDDAVKGGLIIGIWIGLSFLSMEFIEIPASEAVSIIIPVGSFIAAVVIANYIDKSI